MDIYALVHSGKSSKYYGPPHKQTHWNMTQTTKTTNYYWSLLNNRDISYTYTITQRHKFDDLMEIFDPLFLNEEFEKFVNAHFEAFAECIPTKSRAKHSVLLKTLAVKKKRDDVKTAFLCNKRSPTSANIQKFKKAKRKLINAYQKEQLEYIQIWSIK